MIGSEDSITSLTLLFRLQGSPTDESAWGDFVARYGNKIHHWCRVWGLQEADAQDVTQNVLLELSKQMHRLQYRGQGRFRSWLKTIAYRAWCDFLKGQQRTGQGSGDSVILKLLHSLEAREDFLRQMEEECNRELLELAMLRVQQRVQPNTWEAFRLMTFEGLSGAEAAQQLNMKVGSVFVAKGRIDRMLSEEVRRADEGGDN